MQLNKKNAGVIIQALRAWREQNLISNELEKKLEDTIEVTPFDWQRLSRYSFITAIIAFLIAVGAIFSDEILINLIKAYFNSPAIIKLLFLLFLTTLLFAWGTFRKKKKPNTIFRNESIFFLGVIALASTLYQIGNVFQLGLEQFDDLILLGCVTYALLGFFLQSPLIWAFSLLSLGAWIGAQAGYMSGLYYLGMSFPIRFALFGGLIIIGSQALSVHNKFIPLRQVTLVIGLLYLFVSLWILSISGGHNTQTLGIKLWELWGWSLVFGLVAIASILHGLKYENATTRGFGLVFLLINLYTKFFEYFWNTTHKAIFFGLFGLSLWFLGSRAETIWRLGKNDENDKTHNDNPT